MRTLAEELGVSTRTLRRDVDSLRKRGIDLVGDRGRGGGLRLRGPLAPAPIQLSEAEVVALVISMELARRVPTLPFAASTGSALTRVLAALPPNRRGELLALTRRVAAGPPVEPATAATARPIAEALLPAFEQAFTSRRCIALVYLDAAGRRSERVVEPQGLLLRSPLWYVLCYDRVKESPRTFRLDRVESIQATTIQMQLRPSLFNEQVKLLGGQRT